MGRQHNLITNDTPTRLTESSLRHASRFLAVRDRELASVLDRCGPPPMWGRAPGFPTLIRIILEQQVSLASARRTFDRMTGLLGQVLPARVVESGEPGLRSMGLTRQKAAYCMNAARAVIDGSLDLPRLVMMGDEEVRKQLTDIKGIGPWTADVYLLMALRRPDIWPCGDLALAAAAAGLKRLRRIPSQKKLSALAEKWRPYRAVAARMLWQHYLAERAARTPESAMVVSKSGG